MEKIKNTKQHYHNNHKSIIRSLHDVLTPLSFALNVFIYCAITTTITLSHKSNIQPDLCDRHTCGPVVSKCQLMGPCQCEPRNNATCRDDCTICLDKFHDSCCSCVGICNPHTENNTDASSYVGLLDDNTDVYMFELLTSEPDRLSRWKTITFPVEDSRNAKPLQESASSQVGEGQRQNLKDYLLAKSSAQTGGNQRPSMSTTTRPGSTDEQIKPTLNCTVAYFSPCMELYKCRHACRSMGASSYRWFRDGCCQCVGQHCLNYGINEEQCLQCPDDTLNISRGPSYHDGL